MLAIVAKTPDPESEAHGTVGGKQSHYTLMVSPMMAMMNPPAELTFYPLRCGRGQTQHPAFSFTKRRCVTKRTRVALRGTESTRVRDRKFGLASIE